MSAAQTLQFPQNTTPNTMPVAPPAAEAVQPSEQYAVAENAAVPAPQETSQRGSRPTAITEVGPYTSVAKPPKALRVRHRRGLDLSALPTLPPGEGIYCRNVKEGTVRAAIRRVIKETGKLPFKYEVVVLSDGRIVVGHPAPVEA